MSCDVFISHSSNDAKIANAACAALEGARIRCWIAPRDLLPSAKWDGSLVRAIDECHAVVLVFSENANTSEQVQREVARAFKAGKPVVPLRIENVQPSDGLAFYLDTVHWLDALTPPIERSLEKLVDTVKAILAATAPHAAQAHAQAASEKMTEQLYFGIGTIVACLIVALFLIWDQDNTGLGLAVIFLLLGIAAATALKIFPLSNAGK